MIFRRHSLTLHQFQITVERLNKAGKETKLKSRRKSEKHRPKPSSSHCSFRNQAEKFRVGDRERTGTVPLSPSLSLSPEFLCMCFSTRTKSVLEKREKRFDFAGVGGYGVYFFGCCHEDLLLAFELKLPR